MLSNILKSHCPHAWVYILLYLWLWEQLLFVAKECQCSFWLSQLCHAYSLHEDIQEKLSNGICVVRLQAFGVIKTATFNQNVCERSSLKP